MKVEKSKHFLRIEAAIRREDSYKIYCFIEHVKQRGFVGLEGKNKCSDNVPFDDPDWYKKVRYAQQHNLWHYHIGIPRYEVGQHGFKTSRYIIHYIREKDHIKIIDLDYHPPFRLPTEDKFQ